MPDLRSVIQRFRSWNVEDDAWLYIVGKSIDLRLDTAADLGVLELAEDSDEQIDPPGFRERGLRSIIDQYTVRQCIEWADGLSGNQDDTAAADIIRYYIRFDAWPETLNAPAPPPAEECIRRIDRAFADKLGPEDSTRKCRREGCGRGTVKLSVLCRRHHFEMIQGKPYPFED
jgi:hypothetical protein